MPITKTTITFTVFHHSDQDLKNLEPKDIIEETDTGSMIGGWKITSSETVPPDNVADELKAIGNDGSFFEEEGLFSEEEEEDAPSGKLPRLLFTFQPEAWQNDYAIQIDGTMKFDGTLAALDSNIQKLLAMDEGSGDNGEIAVESNLKELRKHSGPFSVYCTSGDVTAFFEANGFDQINEEAVTALRKRYGLDS